MIYLKFEARKSSKEEPELNKVKEFLATSAIGILNEILPEGNPDYDELIDEVKTWLVEIDEETKFPNREIGIDEYGKVIMTMPDRRNYGYWSDNNLDLEYFENHFEIIKIENEVFEALWKSLKKRKPY